MESQNQIFIFVDGVSPKMKLGESVLYPTPKPNAKRTLNGIFCKTTPEGSENNGKVVLILDEYPI
jgi:hypothetical protein